MYTKSLYISSLEPRAGSLFVSIGLMEFLKRKLERVAFFRPIVEDEHDSDTHFILNYFKLSITPQQAYGLKRSEVESLIAQDKLSEVIERLIHTFKKLEKEYDFVLCEGLNRQSFSTVLEYDINLLIAKNLGCPVVSIINAKDKSAEQLHDEIGIECETLSRENSNHIATFVNRLQPDVLETLQQSPEYLPTQGSELFLVPEVEALDLPTVGDIMRTLECQHLFGDKEDLNRIVKQSRVAAMGLENYIAHIQEGDLIIVPGDRTDIIIGTLLAVYSHNYPAISGILLTGGLTPHDSIVKLLEGFSKFIVPILSTQEDTYHAALLVDRIPSSLRPHSESKIALALGLFQKQVNLETIEEKVHTNTHNITTPSMFQFQLFEMAKRVKKCIVLPESNDDRILRAAEILLRRDAVDIILLGDEQKIAKRAALLGLDLSKATVLDPFTSELMEVFVQAFFKLREKKGLHLDAARDALMHYNYFATMMVHMGYADGMVSGAKHTTGDTIRPALQIIKTKKEVSIISSIFFMCMPTSVLVYGDCAVNQDPSAQELAQIATSSAQSALMFDIQPRVAMLSYSTGSSGSGKEVDKVKEATALAQKAQPSLLLDGPMQYDAAIDKGVAASKMPNSNVAGQATVFIFPDLNTGNNTYKAVQRSSGAVAIGPVLQGLNKPVNDLSRGCKVEDIVNTVAITAIQAQE